MTKPKYDFAGWVTKNDIRCSDGVTIRHGAFKDNHGKKVPLVWNHNTQMPGNILGHVILHNTDSGVYGYGHFNSSEDAQHAKELVKHGDISSMSIGANKVMRHGQDVVKGNIYEVSLVLTAANPGARIESVLSHSDDGDEVDTGKLIIQTGNLIHSADDIIDLEEDEEGMTKPLQHAEKTVGEVLDTLNEEQMAAVETLLANAMDADDDDDDDDEMEQSDEENDLYYYDESGDEMKHNVFNAGQMQQGEVLTHGEVEAIFTDAQKLGSLKAAMLQHGVAADELQHSVTNIDYLFPDAKAAAGAPFLYKDPNTATTKIMAEIKKSPFSRVKTIIADLTAETARAKGYITGNQKLEQVYSLLTRSTNPQTVYKKQKLDRDDLIDITDFNVVSFINMEMRMMLLEEIARAVMVGDGRDIAAEDKINAENIRPIITDDDLYTIKATYTNGDISNVIDTIITQMANYRGSGNPTMYVHPSTLAALKLLRVSDTDKRFLFGDIPSAAAIATRLGVKEIVETTFLPAGSVLIVNLNDYTIGSTKGGEVTTFDDFDIDYNQYKYLIETRLSGALVMPKSAIYITEAAGV